MAQKVDEPERKKRKTMKYQAESDIEGLVSVLKKDGSLQKIKTYAKSLCETKNNSLGVIVIENSNASLGYGVPFSMASCPTRIQMEQCFSFASIFPKGFSYLEKLLNDSSYVLEDENVKLALSRLLGFIANEDSKDFVKYLGQKKDLLNNETRLSVALAEHLLSKLSPWSEYTLDNHCKSSIEDIECRCGCHVRIKNKFGNTSIGHPTVWHGNVDIIVGKEVPVVVIEPADPESPGGTTLVEIKHHFKNECIEDFNIRSQMIAQTIVFSFLQHKRHPDADNFLIPCIGMTARQMIFFFYDSKHDVLLQSPPMPLTFGKDISYTGVIALWLVLNYKYFCSGLSPYTLEHASKAEFLKGASDDIKKIYTERLSIGNDYGRDMPYSEMFNPSIDERTCFIYPPDIPKFEW